MLKIKRLIIFLLIILLFYSRFFNLNWGFPYPMHPDERNMAAAIQNLNCDPDLIGTKFEIRNCLNPRFFAYGQFPLYSGYAIVMVLKFFDGDLGTPISFEEAVISLRFISAVASILNVFVLVKLVDLLLRSYSLFVIRYSHNNKLITNNQSLITFLFFIFSPFFIQFSHFGTTESLLMLLYSIILYLSLQKLEDKAFDLRFLLFCSAVGGLAIATKLSSVFFLVIPLVTFIPKNSILARPLPIWLLSRFFKAIFFLALTMVFSVLFSPHNFISFNEFLGSMRYESDVAFGIYDAFYTKQFYHTIPILFQFSKIFPYVLGGPVFLFFILGFLFLPWSRPINLIRIAFVTYFMAHAVLYAKWTRFMAPILPVMLLFAVLFLFRLYSLGLTFIFWISSKLKSQSSKPKLKTKNVLNFALSFAFCTLIFAFIIPGIAYLSIYQGPDVRFTASEWIFKNVPSGSYILSETANVVDLPVFPPNDLNNELMNQWNSRYISFNFYDTDNDFFLRNELLRHISRADYIYVPSRRVFANHTCITPDIKDQISKIKMTNQISKIINYRCEKLKKRYPLLNDYYQKLFSGELGFEKVAEFSSFPSINVFGLKLLEFPDEEAEETWSVFDHPVIRVYKRVSS